MIIKKFQGKTEKEALEAAQKELGSGVVLMSAKELKRKGFLAFFKPRMMEVTVALEEEPDRVMPAKREQAKASHPLGKGQDVRAGSEENVLERKEGNTDKVIEEKLENLQSLLEKQLQKTEADKTQEEEKGDEEKPKQDDSNVRFLKLLYHTMLENEINEKYAN